MRVRYAALATFVFVANVVGAAKATKHHIDTYDLVRQLPEFRRNIATTSLLRGDNAATTRDEERGLPESIIEKAKTAFTATEVTETTLKSWLNKGKSIDDVFTRMRLTQAGDKIFDNPQFFTWLKYADDLSAAKPEKAPSVVATLTAHYGDDVLLRILQAAAKVKKHKEVAVTLEKAQVQRWLVGGESVDDVFRLLKLDKAGADVFSSPMYNTWATYLKIFNGENPTKKANMYGVLRAHYSDDVLSKIFEAGKSIKSLTRDVKRMEATYFQQLLGSGKTPDDVFVLLKLDKTGDDLLSSPQLNTFTNYMKMFNQENPDKQTSLIAAMITSYGDKGVIKLLESGKKVPNTREIATDLETAQFNHWLSNDKGPGVVFKTLSLNMAGNNLLSVPQFSKFTRYSDAFYNKYPGKKMTTMSIIRESYSDIRVVKMIMAAENVPSTKNAVKRMKGELFKSWADPEWSAVLKLKAVSNPDAVFKSLHLDTAGDAIFVNPVYKYWKKFMKFYNKVNPSTADFNIGSTLTTNYGDIAVVKMIMAAEQIPHKQNAARSMEHDLFKSWTDPSIKLDDVFISLKLDIAGDKLFANPMFSFWMKFLDDYNRMVPGKSRPRTILTKIYDDEALLNMINVARENPSTKTLANKLETEMLTQFLYAEKQPMDVAKLLNVREKSDPNWKLWKKYMQDYHKVHFRGITN
ncbi:Avirulence protein (Avh) [Phytophthora palmivora]|uniref:Avirulence protein (Avh) n=1 Tax=Phytophthora palmivora TaxID=4796 RepID=A0A2P4YDJ5_9STRA|nr:Avirulence protein (Avh) [Phytophthora palmivora]